ncbi:MAG: hypothetical protein HY782_02980 [Chloroflexi bacterium]|nr:hypothetical protein [Chloroflexota bacterium]
MSAISLPISIPSGKNHKLYVVPIVAGLVAALAMFGFYILLLTVFQDFSHAMQQAGQDWLWVGLVALGFGAQIGLYAYLRMIIHAAQAAGVTAMTGAGTGTSTLGMIACCAHHLSDIAPLVALTGASGLSGVIGFFNEWKYAFIALGLVMNAIGIVVTVRTIRKHKAHLLAMASEPETAPACH